MLTGLSSRPAPRPCSACHQGRFAPAIRPATHARVPLPLKGGRSFATRLLNVSRSVSDDCKGENAAEKPPADPSEASGIWEAFSAESFEAYTAADPQYKDRPVQVKLRSVMSSKDMSSISYVGTSEEERLPAGFKYAGCDKKEVVLLQGFDWESWQCQQGWYNRLSSMVQEIKSAGFTHIWLPPPSQSVSAQGYLPSVLYNMDSEYGSYKDLKQLLKDFNEAGVAPMADIVINHRCAQEQDENGVWNKFGNEYQAKYGLGGYGADHARGIDWDRWAITCDDPKFSGSGSRDSGADYEAAPDLDHHNPELRAALKDWLNWLHTDMGYAGWRMDFVKGYAPEYVKEYIEDTIGADRFHVLALCDYLDKSCASGAAFDFPMKGILQYAIAHCEYNRLAKDGKLTGLVGWWPEMAVTFIDNHDTGGSQNHWPFPKFHIGLGYAFILTHPGTPCIFWDHIYGGNDKLGGLIKDLIQIRKRNNIKSNSPVKVKCAEKDLYMAEINGSVAIKCGPRIDMGGLVPRESDGWKLVASGKDFAVWEKEHETESALSPVVRVA